MSVLLRLEWGKGIILLWSHTLCLSVSDYAVQSGELKGVSEISKPNTFL